MPTVVQFRRGTTAQNDVFVGAAGELSVDTEKDTLRVHDGTTAGGFEILSADASQTITNKTPNQDWVPASDSAYDLGSSSNKWKDLYLSGSTIYLGNATISASGSSVVLPAGSTIGSGALLDSDRTNALITSAINNLVDGAPDALNTLNELAAAIGDDSNFVGTITSLVNSLPDSAQTLALFSGGTGITYNSVSGVIATDDAEIVHDNLSGFVSNEHIDHSGVSITAGAGLTGGGDITTSRTINVVGGGGINVNADNISIDSGEIRALVSAGTGLSYNSSTGEFSVPTSGVTAGTYGSASLVPIITVDAQGFVDSIGTVSVAGVSSTTFDSATGVFTINTADGGSYATTIADSDFTAKRARESVSVTDTGGDGSLSYNQATGVFTYTGPSASEVRAHFTGGTGIDITTGTISTNDAEIVHDNLSGFVANEHIDHSGVSITAGSGLTGGGNITASRTLNIGEGTGITVSADAISTNDAEIVHDNLSGFVANEHIDHSTVSITAGDGLTGGGTIAATRTLNIGEGTGITVSADAISTNDAEIVHDNLSGFVSNEHIDHSTVSITAGNGLTGGGDLTSTRTINVVGGGGINVGTDNISIDSAEIRALFSATDAGGDGSFSYNSGTGTFTYTGPSASEVRAHFSAGTGVTLSSGEISIGQAVATTSDVVFATVETTGNLVVGGNLQVDGTTTTVNTQNLSVSDNMIYLNDGESAGSPTAQIDLGFAGNYNDNGSYAHAGFFRDATDDKWKVFDNYSPEPDAALEINTGHATFRLAPFVASTLEGKYLGADSDIDARLSGGTGITYSSGTISTNDAQIVHDNLSGFVANEHIDHSTVSITAGSGLTGGGTIAASRTLNIGEGTGITVSADAISTNDAEIVHDNLSGFVANEHVNHSNVSITAGSGLTGGGDITTTRTLNIGEGTGITVSANAISTNDAEIVHDNLSGFVANEHIDHSSVSITAGNGLTGGGTIASSRTINVVGGGGINVGADNISIDSAEIRALISGSTGISYNNTTGAISTNDAQIVHDNLSGFVANEHINHSSVSITAGNGLTGGGDITTSRTINVVGGGGINVGADNISIDSAEIRALFSASSGVAYNSTTGAFTHADTSSASSVNNSGNTFIQDITIDGNGHVTAIGSATVTVNDATITLSAGTGLSGGGNFTTNQGGAETITFNVDLNELSTTTTNGDGDYFVVVDTSGTTRKLTKGNVNISGFNNDAGYLSSLLAGTAIDIFDGNGIGLDLSELSTSTTDGHGDFFVVVDASNVQRKLTKANIAVSGFNNDAGYLTSATLLSAITSVDGASSGIDADLLDGNQAAAFALLAGATFTGDVSAPNFNSTSDVNLKENIETIQNASQKVSDLRGVNFDWKQTGQHAMGVIAQEVEQVIPEVVATDNQGNKSVNYQAMVGLLIEAVKDLQNQVNELKK